ncbi:MAG: hypothetical protein ACP6IP_03440 [Candidatus Njordarchaeia archaeon]
MSDIVDLVIVAVITFVIFAIIYSTGAKEKKGKEREALFPFTSGEKVKELKIMYKIKWIYYIALFTIFEAATMLLLLSIGTKIAMTIGIVYVLLLGLALYNAPEVEEGV